MPHRTLFMGNVTNTDQLLCVFTCVLFFNILNSANEKKDETASQSNQVKVDNDGWCVWEPFFQWSISHCAVDSTWFPFDEQHCSLIYESWKYPINKMYLHVYHDYVNTTITSLLSPNDIWEITGKPASVFIYFVQIIEASGFGVITLVTIKIL